MPSRTPDRRRPVPPSEELLAPVSPGVELCYQTFGHPEADPLLLVMGLGGPMTWWPSALCEQLAEAGFFVVRYDNRDTGRSTRMPGRVTHAMLVRAFLGRRVRAPYSLADLADDAFGLMDHLGLDSAHVAGLSMGGMVAQTMAIAEPRRVRSLTSIMSTTGRRSVGWQSPRLLPALVAPRQPGREAYVRTSAALWRMIGSPEYPVAHEVLLERARETYDRGFDARGVLRQTLAVLTQPDRTRRLRGLRMPTAVVHGLADHMVHVSGGRATAAAVPGAELVLIDGMGHDLPEALHPSLVDVLRRTADRAAQPAS
ncbi:alpha/beta fold hydrolase [Nocardioides campestrisoli]|uniref:alpha/beta fold hydrolase n=1 Tax=Nocardioides campestrisoli TaxID=2736757 RepID=UPI00163DB852|nr:alpha/beta fold hydrolase [Nocardioides campestrisoli]